MIERRREWLDAARIGSEVAARHPGYAPYLLIADGLASGPSDVDSERVLGGPLRLAFATGAEPFYTVAHAAPPVACSSWTGCPRAAPPACSTPGTSSASC